MDLLNALNSVNKPKTKTIVPSVEKVVPAKPKPVKKAKVKTEPPSSQTQTVFPSSETNAVKEEVVFHVPSNKEIKPSTPVHQTSKVTLVETPSSFSLDESSMNLETKKTRKSSNNKTNYSKIVSGITRVQRHNVLALMIQAVSNFRNRFDNTFEVDEIVCREFMTRLETRIFESVCMHKMPPCFNLYRSNLYKRVTHELIWSLRRNAKKLLSFEPEFLASLPAHMLIQGSACGTWYVALQLITYEMLKAF